MQVLQTGTEVSGLGDGVVAFSPGFWKQVRYHYLRTRQPL